MQAAYPILQSGFIGMTEKGFKRPDPMESSFRDAVIFKEVKFPLSKYKFSPLVKELFTQWSQRPELLKNFEFRERIIDAAFKSFGSFNFHTWLQLQNEMPTIGELHKNFIYETLDYLLVSNQQRKIENVLWIRLLEVDDRPRSIKIDVRKYFQQETTGAIALDEKLPTKLENIIQLWVSKERGFEDLLISLYVIFGDRSPRTTVTKETT